MVTPVAINGLGRIGRLVLRALVLRPELGLTPVAANEPGADAEALALLVEFDSVQGRFRSACSGEGQRLVVGTHTLALQREADPNRLDWRAAGAELVLECSGRFRTPALLQPHLGSGARSVVVSAPVKGDVPNVVVGVNHDAFDLRDAPLLSAASCTTNALAPVVRVLHDGLGIERGAITTVHDPTNTQSVVDAVHTDPRRGRASSVNLVPTSTNSAHAVTRIVPELAGRLDSIAVRVPVMNASLVDAVLQVARPTTTEAVNELLERASNDARLRGILGYETRPLVSSDYAGDARSGIVDALSTRVIDESLVKVLVWYDNEWGYANRMVELAAMSAGTWEGR